MMMYLGRLEIPAPGINLDHENIDTGGLGHVTATLYESSDLRSISPYERDAAREAEFPYARRNLLSVLAGAASDAKLLGEPPRDALEQQPGDHGEARRILESLAFSPDQVEDAISSALTTLQEAFDDPSVWGAIEEIAARAQETGTLSGQEVRAIAERHIPLKPLAIDDNGG
jgi:hypothetical protein